MSGARLWLCWGGLVVAAQSGGCSARSPAVEPLAAPLTAADGERGAVRMGFSLPSGAVGRQAFYEITHSSGWKTHGSIQPDKTSRFEALVDGLKAQKGYQLEVNAVLDQGCPCGGSAVFGVAPQAQTTVALRLDCPRKQRDQIATVHSAGPAHATSD